MTRLRALSPALPALLASVSLAACGDSPTDSRGARERVSLSFAAASPGGQTAGTAGVEQSSAGLRIASGNDVLVITRAQLVLKEVELKLPRGMSSCAAGDSSSSSGGVGSVASAGASSSDDDDRGRGRGSDDCDEIERGPVLVELPLDGQAAARFAVSVPAGEYRELELELDKPDDDTQRDRDFRAAHPEFNRTSVRVEGTFNGRAFVYTSRARAEMELHFSPALVVDAGGSNVTVRIDVSGWFRSANGTLIDPGAGSAAAVDANIARSFEAFGDRDRNGRRDGDRSDDGSHGRGRGGDDA